MIVHDLDVAWPFVRPPEADAPLRVDPDAVLTGTVAAQRFEPVARQPCKVQKRLRAVQQNQSARGLAGEALKCRNALPLEKAARVPVPEAPNPAG